MGVSGVGKTKILQALDLVRDVARDNNYRLDGINWIIRLTHLGREYHWELKSALMKKSLFQSKASAEIIYERLIQIENNKSIELLVRSKDKSSLRGKKTP